MLCSNNFSCFIYDMMVLPEFNGLTAVSVFGVVSLQDINLRKPFKSSVIKDQQIVSLASRSQAISEKYGECEPPPTLHKLDAYRYILAFSLFFYIIYRYKLLRTPGCIQITCTLHMHYL